MRRKKNFQKKAYWVLIQSAMKDREVPEYKKDAEKFLLRFAPTVSNPQ